MLRKTLFIAVSTLLIACDPLGDGNGIERIEIRVENASNLFVVPENPTLRTDDCKGRRFRPIAIFTDGTEVPFDGRVTWSVESGSIDADYIARPVPDNIGVEGIARPSDGATAGETATIRIDFSELSDTQVITFTDELIETGSLAVIPANPIIVPGQTINLFLQGTTTDNAVTDLSAGSAFTQASIDTLAASDFVGEVNTTGGGPTIIAGANAPEGIYTLTLQACPDPVNGGENETTFTFEVRHPADANALSIEQFNEHLVAINPADQLATGNATGTRMRLDYQLAFQSGAETLNLNSEISDLTVARVDAIPLSTTSPEASVLGSRDVIASQSGNYVATATFDPDGASNDPVAEINSTYNFDGVDINFDSAHLTVETAPPLSATGAGPLKLPPNSTLRLRTVGDNGSVVQDLTRSVSYTAAEPDETTGFAEFSTAILANGGIAISSAATLPDANDDGEGEPITTTLTETLTVRLIYDLIDTDPADSSDQTDAVIERTVEVIPSTVTALSIIDANTNLCEPFNRRPDDQCLKAIATLTDINDNSNTFEANVTSDVIWRSSDHSVAVVSNQVEEAGYVVLTGASGQSADITATLINPNLDDDDSEAPLTATFTVTVP